MNGISVRYVYKNKEYDGIAIYLYSPFMNSIKLSTTTNNYEEYDNN